MISESTPQTVLYRGLKEDNTYTPIITIDFINVIPEQILTHIDHTTKTVDESATFSIDIPADETYTYQWNHNGQPINVQPSAIAY